MKKTVRNIGVYALFLVFSHPHTACAMAEPSFTKNISPITKIQLEDYLKRHGKTPIEQFFVAEIDLNEDGIPELITKKLPCDKKTKFCDYSILAKKDKTLINLLSISAKNIAVSDTKSDGIHDILAIRSEKNDYKYERYKWSPEDMTFIQSER